METGLYSFSHKADKVVFMLVVQHLRLRLSHLVVQRVGGVSVAQLEEDVRHVEVAAGSAHVVRAERQRRVVHVVRQLAQRLRVVACGERPRPAWWTLHGVGPVLCSLTLYFAMCVRTNLVTNARVRLQNLWN